MRPTANVNVLIPRKMLLFSGCLGFASVEGYWTEKTCKRVDQKLGRVTVLPWRS